MLEATKGYHLLVEADRESALSLLLLTGLVRSLEKSTLWTPLFRRGLGLCLLCEGLGCWLRTGCGIGLCHPDMATIRLVQRLCNVSIGEIKTNWTSPLSHTTDCLLRLQDLIVIALSMRPSNIRCSFTLTPQANEILPS